MAPLTLYINKIEHHYWDFRFSLIPSHVLDAIIVFLNEHASKTPIVAPGVRQIYTTIVIPVNFPDRNQTPNSELAKKLKRLISQRIRLLERFWYHFWTIWNFNKIECFWRYSTHSWQKKCLKSIGKLDVRIKLMISEHTAGSASRPLKRRRAICSYTQKCSLLSSGS